MRQHIKVNQGTTKRQRQAKWDNGKVLLVKLMKTATSPITKKQVRKLFVLARKQALKAFKEKR